MVRTIYIYICTHTYIHTYTQIHNFHDAGHIVRQEQPASQSPVTKLAVCWDILAHFFSCLSYVFLDVCGAFSHVILECVLFRLGSSHSVPWIDRKSIGLWSGCQSRQLTSQCCACYWKIVTQCSLALGFNVLDVASKVMIATFCCCYLFLFVWLLSAVAACIVGKWITMSGFFNVLSRYMPHVEKTVPRKAHVSCRGDPREAWPKPVFWQRMTVWNFWIGLARCILNGRSCWQWSIQGLTPQWMATSPLTLGVDGPPLSFLRVALTLLDQEAWVY